jgi:predicted phosphodiesterase
MRYAVISDIHSNLEALTAVLDYLKENPVDKIISCGDVAGYGPNPEECIEKLRGVKNFESVMGNHDAAICGLTGYFDFNKDAKSAAEINKKLLSISGASYLRLLKDRIQDGDALFLHGSPRDPLNEYLFLPEKFEENMPLFSSKVCFVGHTHQPMLFEWAKPGKFSFDQSGEIYNLEPDCRYIINVGSVGQPRDNNPMACICFFDSKHNTVSMKRVVYDVPTTQDKMVKAGLPQQLIMRLIMGV